MAKKSDKKKIMEQIARAKPKGGQLLPGSGQAGVHRSKKKLPPKIDRKRWKAKPPEN